MLLKIVFYGYLNNIYPCRNIAKGAEANNYFVCFSTGLQTDFTTTNDFKVQKLKGSIAKLFSRLAVIMVDLELVILKKNINDTKIEANV